MRIRIKKFLGGDFTIGKVIDTEDCEGIPLDSFWVRRLKDSATDGCCEIVQDKSAKKGKTKTQVPVIETGEGEKTK